MTMLDHERYENGQAACAAFAAMYGIEEATRALRRLLTGEHVPTRAYAQGYCDEALWLASLRCTTAETAKMQRSEGDRA